MKNQLKKSLSLLMAVLMILSCWVWVAPEKAEAAGEKYYVEVTWNANRTGQTNDVADDGNDDGSCIGFFIKSKDNHGTGTEYTEKADLRGGATSTDNVWSALVTGFPTSIIAIVDHGSIFEEAQLDIKKIRIGTGSEAAVTVFNGCITLKSSTKFKRFQYNVGGTSSSNDSGNAYLSTQNTASWTYPTCSDITGISCTDVEVSKLPNGASQSSTVTVTGAKDQYGVSFSGTVDSSKISYSFNYLDEEGNPIAIASKYIQGSKLKVTVHDEIQTLYPNAKSGKVYVNAWYQGQEQDQAASAEIGLTFPKYTASFYPNGGTIGTSSTNNTSDDNNPIVIGDEKGEPELYYGNEIGNPPVFAQKEGMEFVAYYDQKNDDAAGLYDNFKGNQFNKDNTYTTVDENGDSKWYAAWKAKEYAATFVVGNQYLGTLVAKHNNSMLGPGMYGTEIELSQRLVDEYKASGKDAISFDGSYPVFTSGGTDYVFNGWKIIDADNEDLIYGDLNTVLNSNVTFEAQFIPASSVQKNYTITFYNGRGGIFSQNKNYKFRDSVILPSTTPTKTQDNKYTYEFAGWANAIGKDFYTVDENGYDENGAFIPYISKDAADFTVTEDAGYVPVFKMVYREYDVSFNYTLDGGIAAVPLKISGYHYDDVITLPEEIKDNYTKDGKRYTINGWLSGAYVKPLDEITVTGNMNLTAMYGAGELAEYTIRFYDKDNNLIGAEYDEEGNLINESDYLYAHGTTVTAPTYGPVNSTDTGEYDIPYIIDTDEALYTFVGFKDENGNNYSQTASVDADYYADYSEQVYADVYFYNYDGSLIYSVDGKENKNFVGDTIPSYSNMVDGENKLPEKAEDPVGTYTFDGWKDGSGNTVVPGESKFEGDVHLTAQFATTLKEYTVEFLNDDEVVSREKYKYGEAITVPADPTKDTDDYYSYSFRAWEPTVSQVCYGDATYTATYRRTPIYYTIKWYNNILEEVTTSKYAYNAKIQQANAPDEPLNYGPADEGYSWAFKEWVQCNAQGHPIDENGNIVSEENAVKFVRGMKMPKADLYFYPVYHQVAGLHNVRFYKEDGTFIKTIKIPYDTAISEYTDDFLETIIKESSADVHYIFDKWVTLEGNDLPIAIDEEGKYLYEDRLDENGDKLLDSDGNVVKTPKYIIKGDVSIKPVYTEEKHNMELVEDEIVLAPTCMETGIANKKCVSKYCTLPAEQVIIPVIPDDGKPTGQVYMGSNKWTVNQFDAGEIDYNEVIYVGSTATTIVNAEDTGTRSIPWNTGINLLSRGVGKIDYYVSEVKVDDPETEISVWNNIYNYDNVYNDVLNSVLLNNGLTFDDYYGDLSFSNGEAKRKIDDEVKAILATYKANATGILGQLGLEDGKEYIIYIRITDREVNGDKNVAYLSTGKLSYGTKAAEIAVTGNGYGTKFCAEATIEITDDTAGFTAYLDGEEITLTDGKYVVSEKGVHVVNVVDKHGNSSTKSFEIKGGHTYRNYTAAATCEKAGSKYNLCTLCGHKDNVTEIPAIGHNYVNYVEKAATCVTDGSRVYTCANGCGKTEVIEPDTFNEAASPVKDLKAADIAHLNSTGVHTYAKVKDEKGNDTAEDAWVVDKAATCVEKGEKHRDCTICGIVGRETAEIPVDTENGHNFYRAKVEKGNEATCTTAGKRTQTCRYCKTVKDVETIEALGHTPGEYRTIKEATCTTDGEEVLMCSVCGVDIGEADEDGKYAETPVTRKIEKLGHAWKAEGEPYKKVVDGEEKWVQKYICTNGCTETKEEITEYEEKVAATVTFKNGDADHKIFTGETTKYVGESIIATEVAVPTKASNATYNYVFSHWATKNSDGTYTAVSFPIEVKADATYYAVFTEKYINYTITYFNENGTQYKKVGYLHNDQEVELINGPAKAETTYNTYTFAGWAEKVAKLDENGDPVLDANNNPVLELKSVGDSVTIDGANVLLYATYTSATKKYAVTYAYTASNTIATFEVNAGANAINDLRAPKTADKDFDSKYHYEFSGWNRAAQLAVVESNIYTTPNFTSVQHTLKKSVKTPATCTTDAVVTWACEACGYSYDTTEANTALGHVWGDAEFDETTGKNVVTCQVEGCGVSQVDTRKFTVKFYLSEEEGAQPYKTVNYIPWGTTVTNLPPVPTKESSATTDYKFAGWAVKGTTAIVEVAKAVVKADVDYVAIFTETTRQYQVVFAYDAKNVIEAHTVLAGGNVTFGGETPTKDPDINGHYIFTNWSGLEEGVNKVENVQADVYLTAKFNQESHEYKETPLKAATCTNGEGTRYICDCGYYYDVTGDPLPHDFEVKERKEATPNKDGYVKYKCKNCDATKEEVLKYIDNEIIIQVTVKHNGAPESGVQVEIQPKGSEKSTYATTNSNGVATLIGSSDESGYSCWVVINGSRKEVSLTADADGNLSGTYEYTDKGDCTCACHRNNFWGTIFRFFHKIIKLFTGEFKCCGNPDPMYG